MLEKFREYREISRLANPTGQTNTIGANVHVYSIAYCVAFMYVILLKNSTNWPKFNFFIWNLNHE